MESIEFIAKIKAETVKEFADSIMIENSKFDIIPFNANLYSVRVKPKYQSFLLHPASFANTLVKGEINETVINNPKPEIIVKPTMLYLGFQVLIICFYLFVIVICVESSDYRFMMFFSVIVIMMLGMIYLFGKLGNSIFIGEFIEEQKTGIKRKDID